MNCANHPDRERKAFCQNCGKPLCVECARTVGQAVFCEPCLEIRLAAANAAAASVGSPFGTGAATAQAGYQTVSGGTAYPYTGAAEGIPYSVRGGTPPTGGPNPVVALLLGFIPGVGAMYNGQYAKGVVHLIVFAVLVSLADQNGIFGIFVTAWLFYQAFEAYHTARARRDGTPLPNPFGLNDVGERLGFGRSGSPGAGPDASTTAAPFTAPFASAPPSSTPYPPPADPPSTSAPFGSAPSPFAGQAPPFSEPAPWGAPVETYAAAVPPVSGASRFPVGALVLIGLGVLFLVGSTQVFVGLPVRFLLPVLLIGFGVYLFIRRMTSTGIGLVDDGSADYRLRLMRALQGSVWVVLVGILFLLDTLNILTWGRSWPLFIIVGGVMALLQRSASAAAAQQMPFPGYTAPPSAQTAPRSDGFVTPAPAPPESGTSIAPRDREGS